MTLGAEPVEAFLDALGRGDLHQAYTMLAPDAVLAVPSLRGSLRGRDQVMSGLDAVLTAFPDLRYTSSSRYVAPGQVTDEVMLTGTRLGPWGQVPPTGQAYRLPARVVVEHDGAGVTRLSVWADAESLRALVDDSPEQRERSALPIVSALRASIPVGDPRVILATARDESAAPRQAAPAPRARPTELNAAAAKAAELRVPLPRRVRRTLALAASALMAAAAIGIVVWVAQGALTAPGTAVTPVTQARASTPARSPSPSPSKTRSAVASPSASPAPAYTQVGNRFTLSTDLTFDVDSARLNERAEQALMQIMEQMRAAGLRGTIRVNGFTDSDGLRGHNLELSRQRAEAVALVLRAGLADLDVTVRSKGYGEDRAKASNDTQKGKALNRRVEITVPKPG